MAAAVEASTVVVEAADSTAAADTGKSWLCDKGPFFGTGLLLFLLSGRMGNGYIPMRSDVARETKPDTNL
jgi:hypothetical protein